MQQKASLTCLAIIGLGISGCYLGHIALGQARLLRARQPIDSVLADPATPPALRERLELIESTRVFARELGLDVGGQYTRFVAWPGDRIVTTVVATRPGEISPAGFRFPLLGRLPYKGFFNRERADAEAARLREAGMDVCQFAVSAYSTLGWLDDPVTGPMLRRDIGEVLETILHELVHATFYVRNHVDFNEGVANFIGEEGSVLYYERAGSAERAQQRRLQVEEGRLIDRELLRLRDQIAELYTTQPVSSDRDGARSEFEARARERIAALPLETRDAAQLATGLRLNDACLALTGTYSQDVDQYRELLVELDGDLAAFVASAWKSSEAEDPTASLLTREND